MRAPSASFLLLIIFSSSLSLAQHTKLNSDVENALEKAPRARTDIDTVRQAWSLFGQQAAKWSKSLVSQWRPRLDKIFNETSIAVQCKHSLLSIMTSIENLDEWAIKLIDSWGKFPMSGFLEGTMTDYGDFDECINLEPNAIMGSAQYCSVEFRPLLPERPKMHILNHQLSRFYNLSGLHNSTDSVLDRLISKAHYLYYVTPRIGICMPSKCSAQDIDILTNQVGKEFILQGHVVRCEEKEVFIGLDSYQVTAVLVIVCLLMCAFVGTMFDGSQSKMADQTALARCITAFSLRRNIKKVFVAQSSESSLGCLHGIRVLMMAWIILGHSVCIVHYQIIGNSFKIGEFVSRFANLWIFNGTLSVNTFFFISGMLTTYVTWNMTRGDRKNFNIMGYLLARVFRISPALMVVICFSYLLPLTGSGPEFHHVMDPVVKGCKDQWWVNFLYLNNYVGMDNICLWHTWYLANDMQYHIVSLLVVLPLFKSRLVGISMSIFLLILGTIVAAWITYQNDYPASVLATQLELDDKWNYIINFYHKPYYHYGSYCVGLTFGILLATNKLRTLSKNIQILGWTCTSITMFAILHGIYWTNVGEETHSSFTIMYSACHRTLWAIGLAWIVYACISGQGGYVDKFLSWRGFTVLSRLTFTTYLIHPMLLWIYLGNMRHLYIPDYYFVSFNFLSHWISSYTVALILTLLVESPSMVLQKELLKYLTRHNDLKYKAEATDEQVNNNNFNTTYVLLPLKRDEANKQHEDINQNL
ncbi:Nose resistant to fluoxetine protein 6 [Halotydeus destructor]|nr:Nose resistant to fluoxetine protein 6 [Halotydeus destructor]